MLENNFDYMAAVYSVGSSVLGSMSGRSLGVLAGAAVASGWVPGVHPVYAMAAFVLLRENITPGLAADILLDIIRATCTFVSWGVRSGFNNTE